MLKRALRKLARLIAIFADWLQRVALELRDYAGAPDEWTDGVVDFPEPESSQAERKPLASPLAVVKRVLKRARNLRSDDDWIEEVRARAEKLLPEQAPEPDPVPSTAESRRERVTEFRRPDRVFQHVRRLPEHDTGTLVSEAAVEHDNPDTLTSDDGTRSTRPNVEALTRRRPGVRRPVADSTKEIDTQIDTPSDRRPDDTPSRDGQLNVRDAEGSVGLRAPPVARIPSSNKNTRDTTGTENSAASAMPLSLDVSNGENDNLHGGGDRPPSVRLEIPQRPAESLWPALDPADLHRQTIENDDAFLPRWPTLPDNHEDSQFESRHKPAIAGHDAADEQSRDSWNA